MIEVKKLTKRYGMNKAVDNISFTVNDGEILGFLGPNGAGKSTTMNMLTGYLSATAGLAKINGHEILDDPIAAKQNIGYLPEQPPLYLDMTVKAYLDFVFDLKRVKLPRKQHIAEVCERTRITHVYNRLIKNLSKGYRQRVGMAQAMLGYPPVLILDEPTVGLDPNQIIEVRDLIKDLGKQHTIILSSHILPEVQAICSRVIVINKGKLVADDTPDNLSRSLVRFGYRIYRIASSMYATDYIIGEVERAYRDIARTLYPRIVLAVYGTCPGFWTMVRDDYYEKAKQVVFEGKAKYAKLIEKIDWYHYNVFQKFPQTLKKCKQQGMKVAVIAKYNIQLAPLFKDCMKQADNLVELETASYGATCADIKQLLPDSYINAQEKAGKGKYISPDLKVDASTCLFPDYTWFIKDLPHDVFPNSVNELIMKIFHSKEQFTVDSDEQFSQYLQYESNSLLLSKVTELDLADENDSAEISLRKLLNLFNTLFWLLKNLLNIM